MNNQRSELKIKPLNFRTCSYSTKEDVNQAMCESSTQYEYQKCPRKTHGKCMEGCEDGKQPVQYNFHTELDRKFKEIGRTKTVPKTKECE